MDIVQENEVETEKKIGYKDILSQHQYMKVIFANVISRFGDSIDAIAFTWLVYAVTKSAAWTAVIFAMNQLPSVILQPFTGALVERMNKKRIMVLTDIVRGIIVAGMAGLYVAGMITPFILIIFTLIISSVEAFCLPASISLIPKIIEKKYYGFGTSLNSSISNIMQLIGMGMAGIIIGCWGIETAILIDGTTFLLSALITSTVKVKENIEKHGKLEVTGYFEELKDGFSYIRVKKAIFNFCALGVLINAITVPLNSLQTPMAVEMFGMGSEFLSVFGMAMVIGMSIGAMLLPYLMRRYSVRKIIVGAGVSIGICYGSFILGKYTYGQQIPSYVLCAVLSLLLGTFISWVSGVLNIQFMNSVEEEYLARAASIFNACACAATPVASFLVSALTVKFSVSTIFALSAIGCILVFVITGVKKVDLGTVENQS